MFEPTCRERELMTAAQLIGADAAFRSAGYPRGFDQQDCRKHVVLAKQVIAGEDFNVILFWDMLSYSQKLLEDLGAAYPEAPVLGFRKPQCSASEAEFTSRNEP